MRLRDAPRTVRTFALVPAAAVFVTAETERASDLAARRLSWAVIGLLVLAGVISVATIVFWRYTRPRPGVDPAVAMRWIADEPGFAATPEVRAPALPTFTPAPLPAAAASADRLPGSRGHGSLPALARRDPAGDGRAAPVGLSGAAEGAGNV